MFFQNFYNAQPNGGLFFICISAPSAFCLHAVAIGDSKLPYLGSGCIFFRCLFLLLPRMLKLPCSGAAGSLPVFPNVCGSHFLRHKLRCTLGPPARTRSSALASGPLRLYLLRVLAPTLPS